MRKITCAIVALLVASGVLFAQEAYVKTGEGVRVKKIAFVGVNVYYIVHQMKGKLPPKNAAAIINADQDKVFSMSLMRDIDSQKIVNAIQEAYALNGYGNPAHGLQLFSVVTGDLKNGDNITIAYNAATKTTSCYFKGKGAAVGGVEFMKATWSIWFGKIDQPGLTQALMAQMP